MRVYISSTPDELELHRAAALEVAAELGFEPTSRDLTAAGGLDPVASCARQVAAADLVLAIVGWRGGRVPTPELGGDGLRFWAWWEVRSAFDHGKPVVVLMAAGAGRSELRDDDARARAVMRDFRGELDRVAVFFEPEQGATEGSPDGDPMAGFRQLVRRELLEARRTRRANGDGGESVRLRDWPPPPLPERPYPLLLPYSHPDLLAGRERELEDLRQTLDRRLPLIGLHAPSGTGKSSLLAGGLVPRLRAEGRPVAFDRQPAEPDMAGRLLGQLLEPAPDVEAPGAFIDRLVAIRRLPNGDVPLLVLDQFEDLLRSDDARPARAVAGKLLAASMQRQPALDGPVCQWLVAYRREFHGEVLRWLKDVLRDARAEGLDVEGLPHELSRPERFFGWPLRPLATLTTSSGDGVAGAARVFQEAIEKPLNLTTPEGEPCYPWYFAPGHAARLAWAFGEARAAQPGASLVPELQVVLAHLLVRAGEPDGDQRLEVRVPEEPGELIDRALEEHLRRALDTAYPEAGSRAARRLRTRALLALRELADVRGRRDEGLPADSLAKALGRGVLKELATPQTRLVVLEEHDGGWRYVLSHDRLAELLVKLVDGHGADARFGVDTELLGLRRFVTLQSTLFETEPQQATKVPAAHFRRIEENTGVLLWGEQQRRWWKACRDRRRQDRLRRNLRGAAAALIVTLMALGAWNWAERRAERRALLDEIATGDPEPAFAALDRLTRDSSFDQAEILDRLATREAPFDVLERGLGGVGEARRAEVLLRVAELALPILEASPEDPVLIASLVWALDFFAAPDPALAQRAAALRNEALGGLRQRRPPPVLETGDPSWTAIQTGTLRVGTGPDAGRDAREMGSQGHDREVAVAGFWIQTHETTNADYRQLVPGHKGAGDLPVVSVTWYEAYSYAAWLGGRLPTESEWQYAARAGCAHAYCKRDGSEATVDEVRWWQGNSADVRTGERPIHPIMQLAPNRWGLWDVYGNAWEWNATCCGSYTEELGWDPRGSTPTSWDKRTMRGGSVWNSLDRSRRRADAPSARVPAYGFRVLIPEPGQ